MENANKVQHWNKAIVGRVDSIQPTLIVGIVLIVILGGLTSFSPLLGMTSALVLFLWVLVASRPELIVYGLVLILPLTGGLARGAVVPLLRLGQTVLVVGFILFLLAKPTQLGKSRLTAIDLAFVLFFLSEAVFPVLALYSRGEHLDLSNTNNIYGVSPVQTLLGPLQYYLLYRIVVATITSEKQITVVLKLSFVASIIVSVIGIVEEMVPPFRTFIQLYYPPISPISGIPAFDGRIASTLQHYSGLGAYLVFTIIIVLVCSTAQKPLRIPRLLLIGTLLLNSITLLLTGTFAAWIGLAVGMAVVFVLLRRLPKTVIFALVGIVLAILIFQPFISARLNQQLGAGAIQGFVPQSFAFRIRLWQQIFLPAVGHYLLFGAGPAPAVLNAWPTEETQFLYLLLRGGLPYFFSYCLLMGIAIVVCWRQIKGKSEDGGRLVSIALIAIVVSINIMNVTGAFFTYTGGTQTLWTLLAIVVASGQFKVSEISAADKSIANSKRRVSGISFRHRPAIAVTAAVDRSTKDGKDV